MIDYAALAALICGLTFFSRAAKQEKISTGLWSGLSVAASGIAMVAFKGGWLSVLLSQVILFVLITVYRVVFEKDGRE